MTGPHEMNEADAKALTGRVREEAERTWALLVEAHDGGAWTAQGYGSCDEYVVTEFDVGASPAFRPIERARVGVEHEVEVKADETPHEVHLSATEVQDFVGQVVLSLEALTMGCRPQRQMSPTVSADFARVPKVANDSRRKSPSDARRTNPA